MNKSPVPMIVAVPKNAPIGELELATYIDDTRTPLVTNVDLDGKSGPFGGTLTLHKGTVIPASADQIAALVSIGDCPACGTKHLTTASYVGWNLQQETQEFACLSCGNALEFAPDPDQYITASIAEDEDSDDQESDDQESDDSDDMNQEDGSDESDDSEDSQDDSDDQESDDESEDNYTEQQEDAHVEDMEDASVVDEQTHQIETPDENATEGASDDTSTEAPVDSSNNTGDEVTKVSETPADATIEQPAAVAPETTTETPVVAEAASLEIAAVSCATFAEGEIELLAGSDKNSMYVMVNGVPAGTLNKNRIPAEFASAWGTTPWNNNFVNVARGLTKGTLDELGFRPFTVTATVDRVVADAVETAAVAAKAQVDKRVSDTIDRLVQGLETASIASTKDIWSDFHNPVVTKLANTLLAAGVQDANQLVTAAFAECGPEYVKNLVTKAQELAAMSDAERNAIAKLVTSAQSNIKSTPSQALHARLSQPFQQVTAAVEEVAPPAKSESVRARFRGYLGRVSK